MLWYRVFCKTHLGMRNSDIDDDVDLRKLVEEKGPTSSVTLRESFGMFILIIYYDKEIF